jgi:hypothetical protein
MWRLWLEVMGGFLRIACLPCHLAEAVPLPELETMGFSSNYSIQHKPVFSYNDLSQHNIIVDEGTLKIDTILDRAGFYPNEFASGHLAALKEYVP